MQKIFIPGLFISLWISVSTGAQNLIPNPGFDEFLECPKQLGQIHLAYPWTTATNATPDLFNTCATPESGLQVPFAGPRFQDNFRIQRSGTGYAGIYTYFSNSSSAFEFIQTPLMDTLEKGKMYFVEFYVATFHQPYSPSLAVTDAIGVALSDSFYYEVLGPHDIISLSPAAEHTGELIEPSDDWYRVTGCFYANGGETHAIFGNFRSHFDTNIRVNDHRRGLWANYMYIDDISLMKFDPLPDTLWMCEKTSYTFDANFLDGTYLWNNNYSEPKITVQSGGIYSVEVFMPHCVLKDSVVIIDLVDTPESTRQDINFCEMEYTFLQSSIPGDYLWNSGEMTPDIAVWEPGEYVLSVTNMCGEYFVEFEVQTEECDCKIWIPNAFSPNSDGINDKLEFFAECDYPYNLIKIEIFDRWGNIVYISSDPDAYPWDGMYKGLEVPSGSYTYHLSYSVTRQKGVKDYFTSGEVTIFR